MNARSFPVPYECRRRTTHGMVLIDAMVAVLIFSFGIIGMMSLQSAAVNIATSAKFRTDAAMYADQVIAQMWTSSPLTLQANFQSPNGASYKAWAANVTSATPPAGLPGAAGKPPTINVDANGYVTVTVYWQAPSDAAMHQYVAYTQIQQ